MAVGLIGCPKSVGRRAGLPDERVRQLPAEVAESYQLFSSRCSRCHTLSRPLNAGITSEDHWRAYVARMRRNPGSGISPADGERILVFLFYWAKTGAKESSE